MNQFGSLSERGGNFLNLLQKEGVPRKGAPSEKGGGLQHWRKLCERFGSVKISVTIGLDWLISVGID